MHEFISNCFPIFKRLQVICFFIALIIIPVSCQKENYRIATGTPHSKHYRIGKELANILNKNTSYKIELLTSGQGSKSNCNHVLQQKSQFALAQNDVILKNNPDNLRTVMPLYPQLLFIVYHDSLQPTSLHDLIAGRRIAIGPKTGGTASFVRKLFTEFNIAPTEYEFVYSDYKQNTISDSVLVSVSLTAYNNNRIKDMIINRGGKIWSLGDYMLAGRGSAVDGFCLNYPLARPFIIPKQTFLNYPDHPILTLAIDNVLISDKSVNNQDIYKIIETLLDNKESLANRELLFRFLTDDFKNNSFQFPLHKGTISYLERNNPGFFERYAEVIGVSITALMILYGSITTLFRVQARRKKDRIDDYYREVIEIENQSKNIDNIRELKKLVESLIKLRNKAFKQLINEKLAADESFRIFITLLHDVNQVIENKMKRQPPLSGSARDMQSV